MINNNNKSDICHDSRFQKPPVILRWTRRPALNVAQKYNLGPHEREVSYVWWRSSSQAKKYSQTCEQLQQTDMRSMSCQDSRETEAQLRCQLRTNEGSEVLQKTQFHILRQETTRWFQGFTSLYWCQIAYNETQQHKGRWNLVTRHIQLLGYQMG